MITKRLMRPVLAVVLAAFLFTAAGFAQQRIHDLSFQYGFLSIDQINGQNNVPVVISLGNFYKEDMKFSGVPFLTYHYSANSRFGFGGAIGYYSLSGRLALQSGGEVVGDFRERDYVAAAELDYHWIMQPRLQLYSGAGFGLRVRSGTYSDGLETDKVTKVLPTFHLNAIGVRFGGRVGLFLELGLGYKGILVAGINAQF